MADYATLLRDHVTLTCRSVDRIFLQAYVPKLQCVGGVCQFLYWQKGFGIPSSAAFGKIGDAYVAEVHRWAKKNEIPVRRFAKGENKEQIARPLIEAAEREGGDGRVVLLGIAQEKTPVWRSWKAAARRRICWSARSRSIRRHSRSVRHRGPSSSGRAAREDAEPVQHALADLRSDVRAGANPARSPDVAPAVTGLRAARQPLTVGRWTAYADPVNVSGQRTSSQSCSTAGPSDIASQSNDRESGDRRSVAGPMSRSCGAPGPLRPLPWQSGRPCSRSTSRGGRPRSGRLRGAP